MPRIIVHDPKTFKEIDYEPGPSLLQILHQHGISIPAPCGGNGSCGKCRVKIRNQGIVYACTSYPTEDMEVILPNQRESRILTHQYQYSLKLTVEPFPLALSTPYPIGLAIDLGTTTIVFYWINLITGGIMNTLGVANPQSRYGADVISRINYCSHDEKVKNLQSLVVDSINQQIERFCTTEGIPTDYIVKISVSANTTMLHLLAGVDPTSLALAPFKPQFTEAKKMSPGQLGITIHPQAEIGLMPSLSAFVGSDIVSGLASLSPPAKIKNYLFIDIGTNGEMALVTPSKIYCCATAAGPALEGANIFCGMGAFDGAISIYNNHGYQTISDEKPIGICGSGLIDIIAHMIRHGIIPSDGALAKDHVIAPEHETGNGEAIVITPQDIREVQLAKSAIITGIKLLMQHASLEFDQLDALFLAGGFGNYLNPENAMIIGLLPEQAAGKIITVGNTSGTGAILNTLCDKFQAYTKNIIDRSELIELANHPDFELEFAMNMYF